MTSYQILNQKKDMYCGFRTLDGFVFITVFRPENSKNIDGVKNRCSSQKHGLPCAIEQIEDGYLQIRMFSGFNVSKAYIPMSSVIVFQDADY